jgi:hypothetical protein
MNQVVTVKSINRRFSRVDGFVRLICDACTSGAYDEKASDSCWQNKGYNVGTLEDLTLLVERLEQWPGGPDKKAELLVMNHQAHFHMENGERYLVVGCTEMPLKDAQAALAELREIPNVTA